VFAPSLGTWLQKFMATLIYLPQIKRQNLTKEEEKEEGDGMAANNAKEK